MLSMERTSRTTGRPEERTFFQCTCQLRSIVVGFDVSKTYQGEQNKGGKSLDDSGGMHDCGSD